MDSQMQDEQSVETGKPEVSQSRKALVLEWVDRVKAGRKHHEKAFKAMRDAQDFAMYGADKTWRESGAYTVPILPRYINQTVSTLYARNPKTTFKRRERLMYTLWDGRSDSLQSAMEMAQVGDVNAVRILQEVMAVRQYEKMFDDMGRTVQLLWQYFLDEQSANYKQQLKAAVRRAKICKVAWIKLGYQRMLEPKPETAERIADTTEKLAQIEHTLAQMAEDNPEYADTSARYEELRLNMEDLQRDGYVIAREGPVLDFPRATQVIVDPECVHLKSLTGARWVAHEYEMKPERIAKVWGVDVGDLYLPYEKTETTRNEAKEMCARVYEIWDKDNQQVLVVVDGYCDFIKEPATPDVQLERFFPFFPIVFNEVEHDEELYPLSDVEQATHIQNEYNRSREALREHRIAARPYWVEGVGLDPEEKNKLANHAAHEIISIPSFSGKVEDVLQRGPTAPIDPNLYELESHFTDLLRVVGYQEAQIGATAGATATESSIAQQAQSASQSDNVDDLDEVLTELARAGGELLFRNMDKQTVKEIVGDGAVWPDSPMTAEEAAKEIMLEVEAGSSGRPNKAADLANMERGMPYIIQLPGVNPAPIAKKYLSLLDIDTDEAVASSVPSITAINAIIAKMATGMGAQPTGDPQTDPNAQGPQGQQNAPQPAGNEPGPQPAYNAQA